MIEYRVFVAMSKYTPVYLLNMLCQKGNPSLCATQVYLLAMTITVREKTPLAQMVTEHLLEVNGIDRSATDLCEKLLL